MDDRQLLSDLDLGASVAEHDQNLAEYFVSTIAFDDFVADRYDLICGAKGSGKSAILRIAQSQQRNYSKLSDVILSVATEHKGEPSFRRAFKTLKPGEFTDDSLVEAWKTYLLNLALDALDALPASTKSKAAVEFAERIGIRYRTTSAFKKIWWSLLRVLHVKSFEVSPDSVKAEFPDAPPDMWTRKDEVIDFPEALSRCVDAFSDQGKRCWTLLDRLDAAFQDRPALERSALRSLLMAYKDFMGHPNLRIKLLFRSDLFELVASDSGFRELTHVVERTSPPIQWDGDVLLRMIMERFAYNESIRTKYGIKKQDLNDSTLRRAAFYSIFPNVMHVRGRNDPPRKQETWDWLLARIRDGNNLRTPRDLHTLIKNAAHDQLERLIAGGNAESTELISAESLRGGFVKLSVDKVATSLIAENPDLARSIKAFRRTHFAHSEENLLALLGPTWRRQVERLTQLGFLEEHRRSWRIPSLYCSGLEISDPGLQV